VLAEAQATAENGMEDERVSSFGRLVREWIAAVSEPQIAARDRGEVSAEMTALGKARTDEMRSLVTELRNEALNAAAQRERAVFGSANGARRAAGGVLAAAIITALASGIWIARDIANPAPELEAALAATGRLQPLPPLPLRRDELGAVAARLNKVGALLVE